VVEVNSQALQPRHEEASCLLATFDDF